MAVGVPETEVFAAADRVLARGERPTTERVRAELGRGSPARIGALLEQWWEALAKRLAGETRLPDLPPAVAEAFKAVWVSATEHGTALAQSAVAQAATEMAQERARLVEERAGAQHAIGTAHAAQVAAESARQTAEARLGDLQRLLDQQSTQLAELIAQRDALSVRNAQLEQAVAVAQTSLAEQQLAAAQERDALQQHIRATEERAHAEVDRARQDAKDLRGQVSTLQRERTAADHDHRQQLDAARTALARAERDLTAQRARAEALEQQLARLGDLPAALQATLARVVPPSRPPLPVARKPGRARKGKATGD